MSSSKRARRRLSDATLGIRRIKQKLRRKAVAGCERESWTVRKRRGLAYMVLLLGFLQPQRAGAGQDAQGPSLTVLVFNHADVSRATLERAERQVDGIFYKGGFRLIWLHCYPVIATAGELSETH